jgi:hypothetical protein
MDGRYARKYNEEKDEQRKKTGGWQTSRRRVKNGWELLRKGVFSIGRIESAGITYSILSKLSLMGE